VEVVVWDEADGIPINTFAYKTADLYGDDAVAFFST
jgi:hypothetical protein